VTTLASLLIVMGMDTTGVTAGAAKAEGSLASLGTGATKALSPVGLGALAAGAAIGVFAAKSIGAATDFDQAFTRIGAISNASAKDIESWKGQVLDLAGATAKAPKELADALFFLSSAGLDVKQVMPALTASAKAAAAGLGETADVANIVASALNAYSKSGLTAASVTDTLVAAVREGRAEPEEFAGALGRILPIASAIGVTFDQVAGSMAVLSNIGLDVNEAVTAMRGVLQAVAAPGTEAAQALDAMGLSAQDLLNAISEDGIIGALRLLDQTAKASTHTQADYIGMLQDVVPNIRALTGVLGLTGQAADKVDKVFQRVADSTGATDKAFQTTAQSSAFQIKKALNDIAISGQKIASDLLPALAKMLGLLADISDIVIQPFEAPEAPGFDPKFIQFQADYGAAIDRVAEASIRGQLTSAQYSTAIQQIADDFNRTTGAVDIYTHAAIDTITAGLEGRNAAEGMADGVQKLRAGLEGVTPKLDDAGDSARQFGRKLSEAGQKIAEGIAKEIPDIIGTVTTVKETFTLSPAELVKIAHSWAEIARRIAKDLREIAKSDLSPAMREAISALPPEMRDAWVRGNAQQKHAIEQGIKTAYDFAGIVPGLAADALTGGRTTGHAFSSGAAKGIAAGAQDVTNAATKVINDAIAAAKRAAQAESPSKRMAELGHDLMQGLTDGIGDKDRQVAQALTDSIGKMLDAAKSALSDFRSKMKDFAGGISGGFSSFSDLVGGFGQGEEPLGIQDFLSSQLAGAQGFADVLDALKRQGASKGLLSQIAGAGPEGLGFAQALLQGGPELVEQASQQLAAINRIADDEGGVLSKDFFGNKMDKLQSRADRIAELLAEANRLQSGKGGDIVLQVDGQTFARITRDQLRKLGNRNAGTGVPA
jgi:TP901 family phage tail tape measure protein